MLCMQNTKDIIQYNGWPPLIVHPFKDGRESSSSIVCLTSWRIPTKNN